MEGQTRPKIWKQDVSLSCMHLITHVSTEFVYSINKKNVQQEKAKYYQYKWITLC